MSWVFLGIFLGWQIADKVFEEDYVILDEIEGKHKSWHQTYFLLDELYLVDYHRQKLYLLDQKTQD